MIARIWRGRVRSGLLEEYRDYIARTGLREYAETEGNRGAYMLTQEHETHGEVVTVSFWDSYAAIARFAGEPYDRARYYPDDRRFLLEFPELVEHYDVTLADTAPSGTASPA